MDAAPDGSDSDRFLVGALAVLPEVALPPPSGSAQAQAAAAASGGAWGLVPESSVPLGQQTWQVMRIVSISFRLIRFKMVRLCSFRST